MKWNSIRAGLRPSGILVCVIALGTAASAPAEWPLFRGGPTQDGLVRQGDLPEQLTLLWKYETGDAIEGTPAIAGGVVYVGSFDDHLHAIDLKTGQEKWKTKVGPVSSAAAYREGRVYVGDIDGVFHCLDAETGKQLWSFETRAEITGGANFHGENVLIGSHDQTLYCLDPEGKEVWKFETEGPVNGAAAVVGDRTFVAGCDSLLHILDAKTGKSEGSVDMESQAAATAAVAGDKLYVGTMGNEVLAVDWKTQKIDWRYSARRRAQPFYGSAAVTESRVVAGGRDRKLHVIDRANGNGVWEFVTDGRIDSSPVVAGERVYFGTMTKEGLFYVLNLKDGAVIQTLELGGSVIGSPAVSDGRLIVGTERGTVFCYGQK